MGRWIACLTIVLGLPVSAAAQEQRPRGTIEVDVVGLRSDQGWVGCALFDGPEGFPREREWAVRADLVRARDDRPCRFPDVPPGTYAVAVLHDEDRDGELDTGLFGMPTEGYGASRDAHSTFGPPEWEDARFRYDGRDARIRIRLRY